MEGMGHAGHGTGGRALPGRVLGVGGRVNLPVSAQCNTLCTLCDTFAFAVGSIG